MVVFALISADSHLFRILSHFQNRFISVSSNVPQSFQSPPPKFKDALLSTLLQGKRGQRQSFLDKKICKNWACLIYYSFSISLLLNTCNVISHSNKLVFSESLLHFKQHLGFLLVMTFYLKIRTWLKIDRLLERGVNQRKVTQKNKHVARSQINFGNSIIVVVLEKTKKKLIAIQLTPNYKYLWKLFSCQ